MSWVAVGAVAAVIAALTAVAGTVMSVKSSREAGEAQKSWNLYNAEIQRQKADAANKAAAAHAERMRIANERQRATQRLAYGLSGTTGGVEYISDTAKLQELDVQTLLWNARRTGEFDESAAMLLTAQGDQAARAGRYQGTESILKGTTAAANALSSYKGTTSTTNTTDPYTTEGLNS